MRAYLEGTGRDRAAVGPAESHLGGPLTAAARFLRSGAVWTVPGGPPLLTVLQKMWGNSWTGYWDTVKDWGGG